MPQDNVRNRTFQEIFEGDVRYEIPFFQRGYAWEKKQWDQLFEDISEEILPDLNDGSSVEEAEHFFGPIVVLEKAFSEGEGRHFVVIDGQQRITTVYLLLAHIMQRLERLQHKAGDALGFALQLRTRLTNTQTSDDDYQRLKLLSTKGDRLPTYRAVFGSEHNPVSPHYLTDVQIYRPGHNQVDEFTTYVERKFKHQFNDVPSLWQLATVLLKSLKVVWIPLDDRKDDPQAIFESLNDKGMPLSASELICSHLFRPLQGVSDFEQLHNMHWLQAIRLFPKREQFEEYLRNLFSIGEKKMVGKHRKIYVYFKNKYRHLNATSARHRLSEIHECAKLYGYVVNPEEKMHPDPAIRKVLGAISHTRMDSCTPFVLGLLRTHAQGSLQTAQALALLNELLTLLVRRKMTEQPTTMYDTMFPRLFGLVANEPDPVKALQEQFRRNGVWVSDQEFEEALVHRTLYRSRDLAFTRMVLAEIDRKLQTHGQFPDYSTTNTIEHIIPQSLDDHWQAYLGDDVNDQRLDTYVNSIGNLCLLSAPANSHAGQNPFVSKIESYSDVTALVRELKAHDSTWNLEAVRERSRRLAATALITWSWTI